MRQTKKAIARIWWLGRGTATVMGVAVMLAVVLGVATTALAAVPGDPFKLGRTNTIDNFSTLVGSVNNAMLKIDNNSSGDSATALDLRVEPGQAPMKVDSGTKVVRLNADKLDGKEASAFLGVDDQAASADEVDGKDANELVRVASFTGESPLADGTGEGKVATTKINAPSKGFLVIDASSDFGNYSVEGDGSICFVKVDNEVAPGSKRLLEINSGIDANREEDCSTNAVVPVFAGNHTIDLKVKVSEGISYRDTVLSAIYIPFDREGRQPFLASFDPPTTSPNTPVQGTDDE